MESKFYISSGKLCGEYKLQTNTWLRESSSRFKELITRDRSVVKHFKIKSILFPMQTVKIILENPFNICWWTVMHLKPNQPITSELSYSHIHAHLIRLISIVYVIGWHLALVFIMQNKSNTQMCWKLVPSIWLSMNPIQSVRTQSLSVVKSTDCVY